MTIKGRLLSGTAIVMRFRTENFQVHSSDRVPFSLEIRNYMWR